MGKFYGYILGLVLFMAAATDIAAQKDRYLIEAESFQFKGKWFAERNVECMGAAMLRLGGGGSLDSLYDALTAVQIYEAGEYNVWVRSADYENRPGTRLFRLSVNEQPMEVSGKHGHPLWYWEKVGTVALERGQALLRLHDEKKNFGRCDAILLVKDPDVDPNALDRKEIGKWRKNPSEIRTRGGSLTGISDQMPVGYSEKVVASLENPDIRISFVLAGAAGNAIACRTEINTGGVWRRHYSNLEDHKVFILTSADSPMDNDRFYPSWRNAVSSCSFTFGGRKYTVRTDDDVMNPFVSGDLSEAIPVSAVRKDDRIVVSYITRNGSMLKGEWTLPARGTHINVALSCTASEDGMCSMGIAAFQPVPESAVKNVLMPPMFQFRRFPSSPLMMLSSMMQQPLAIVESDTGTGGGMSAFVCGARSVFPLDWGSADWSPIGFSLRNFNNDFQPVAFSPVMGMEDSRVCAGDVIEREFVIGLCPGKWNEALEYISGNVYEVRDYRKQEDTSLTDAVFNIIDLMKDDEYGGWDDSLKGFYDIEGDPGTAPTVVHPAPLAIVAASVVCHDEDFYLERALPSIEYTLSRSGYRWAPDLVPSGYNKTPETLLLDPFTSQFTTSYYAGLDRMLSGLNPWLEELSLPGGMIRQTKGYSAPFVSYVEQMEAYRMTGDAKWLETAESTADRYIGIHIYNPSETLAGQMAFYNSNVYAPWWNLLDMYELTGEKRYLEAAEYGAASTVAGIRSFPAVEDSLQTIHPGGIYEGNTTMWWKGRERFRLGFPRVPGDVQEKQVPQWLVSPVGLGFEQPGTYFLRQKGKRVRPVFMSNWAPHLLRLYRHTGNPFWQTYARNAVIGRFSSYPGYYATGFTDVTMSADYPYKGPDVSSIYYHHIPPHLAFSWDFLVSECIQRSGGNVDFPYSLQEGFVWFTNRIYGGGKGRVFQDRNVSLWMRRGLVMTGTPSVNYLTAISDRNFWVLLSSESDEDMEIAVALKDAAGLVSGTAAVQYTVKGKASRLTVRDSSVTVKIPAKGFAAVSFPLADGGTEMTCPHPPVSALQTPALREGMKILDGGDTFGKIYIFRIRSPFGWDSVYGFAQTCPRKNRKLSVSAECNGVTASKDVYPFEWSFTGIGMEEKAVLKIVLSEEGREDIVKEVIMDCK